MSKKKRIKKIFENAPIEAADVNNKSTEPVPADAPSEETSPDTNPQEEVIETSVGNEESVRENALVLEEANAEITEAGPAEEQNETAASDESLPEVMEASVDSEESSSEDSLNAEAAEPESTDDLLDDVRRSLIEAEGDKDQKESKWWQRIGRKAKKVEPQEPQAPLEIDLPPLPASLEPVEEQPLESESEAEADQIDDLIDLLAAERAIVPVESTAAPEVEVPSEPEVDFEELKKQAFRQPAEGEEAEPLTDVRSMALEGGEEVLVEVDRKAPDPWEERFSAFENALKPYRLYINIALAMLGVVMAVVAALIIFRVYQGSRPAPVQEVSNLPYPSGVSLPGGWSFKLGKGTLQDGKWEPNGAEWLQGTEICRWVSLPWSRQLEAVVRTLNPKDPIELVMSNNDKLVYQVYSVRQLTPEELQSLDSNSPCLLIILTQPDAEKRWVLTAVP
jgi:chemotaxis protein histidine kinase CheA